MKLHTDTLHIFKERSVPMWLDSNQIRPLTPQPAKTKFALDALAEVEWKGDWYAAKVLKVEGSDYLVRYTDYDSIWDEWVNSKRMRARGK